MLGRLEDIDGWQATLAPDLHQNLARADQSAADFRNAVDKYVHKTGLNVPEETGLEFKDGYELEVQTKLDLAEADIDVILWATGFDWDFSWVKLPMFDKWGYPIQERGVTEYPGLYFLGVHWLHTLKSGLFL